MTNVVDENPLFDAIGVGARGVSGLTVSTVFLDLYSGRFSDADSTRIEPSCDAMDVSFRIVMAKRENSGLSAR